MRCDAIGPETRLGEDPVDLANNNPAVDGSIAPVRSAEAARRGRSASLAMASHLKRLSSNAEPRD